MSYICFLLNTWIMLGLGATVKSLQYSLHPASAWSQTLTRKDLLLNQCSSLRQYHKWCECFARAKLFRQKKD